MVLFGGDGRDGARDGVRVRGGRPLTPAAPRVGVSAGESPPRRTARGTRRQARRVSVDLVAAIDGVDPDRRAPSQRHSLNVVCVQLDFFPKFLPALSCAALGG